jgi:hypothetical protein
MKRLQRYPPWSTSHTHQHETNHHTAATHCVIATHQTRILVGPILNEAVSLFDASESLQIGVAWGTQIET